MIGLEVATPHNMGDEPITDSFFGVVFLKYRSKLGIKNT